MGTANNSLRLDGFYVQSEGGPFVLDLGAILNRAMRGAKAERGWTGEVAYGSRIGKYNKAK